MPRVAELAELDDDELGTRLGEYRRELLNLRFQVATSQLDNTARLKEVRRDIARVMTLIREREIALAEGREIVPLESRVEAVRRRAAAREAAEAAAEIEAEREEQSVDEVGEEEDLEVSDSADYGGEADEAESGADEQEERD